MNEKSSLEWTILALVGALFFMCIVIGGFPKYTVMYKMGVTDTYKEAYKHGFMVKEITEDDKVIYKWKDGN